MKQKEEVHSEVLAQLGKEHDQRQQGSHLFKVKFVLIP